MVAPRARAVVEEGQPVGERVDHRERSQQPLRVAMQAQHLAFAFLGDEAVERATEPLLPMDGCGLLAAFVHAQDQAAVHQLFVDVDGRGGQEEHDGSTDLVLLRDQVAGRVGAGARDGQLAFALQELQGIRRAVRAFLFADGQHLVLQVGFSHVEQGLTRERRELHALFFGHEGEHRIHQAGLAGCAAALDDHAQGAVELARGRGQVAHQLVHALADHAASLEAVEDVREQLGALEQGECRFALGLAHRGHLRLDLGRGLDAVLLQRFELEQDAPEVGLEQLVAHSQLLRCRREVVRAMARAVQVHGVHVVGLARGHQQVDLHRLEREVLGQAAHAVAALAERQHHLVIAHLHRQLGRCRRGQHSG